eukprot:3557827-Amphidinium_carterae.1
MLWNVDHWKGWRTAAVCVSPGVRVCRPGAVVEMCSASAFSTKVNQTVDPHPQRCEAKLANERLSQKWQIACSDFCHNCMFCWTAVGWGSGGDKPEGFYCHLPCAMEYEPSPIPTPSTSEYN